MKYFYAQIFMHNEQKRKRRIPFPFPLQLCIVLDDELTNGLDGESDVLAWDDYNVFWVFEIRFKSLVQEIFYGMYMTK